ncbi:MAG: hypothetical protein ACRDYU_03810 [Actinomycetes bacterium]
MGPYCQFCDRRCFVLRVLPDGTSLLMATCPRGMGHDRSVTGHTHETARNLLTDPEAVGG